MSKQKKRQVWRIYDRISDGLYILVQAQDSCARYVPLYVHSFVLCTSRKVLEATRFTQCYRRYEEIQNAPDRLRWCRHSKGLLQSEVAEIAGMTREVYMDIEYGVTQCVPLEMVEKLATYYDVPMTDFMDEYNRFLFEGQANRIQAYREKLGLSRKAFARALGIPLTSLRCWEEEKKTISRKCWEMYFKGRV